MKKPLFILFFVFLMVIGSAYSQEEIGQDSINNEPASILWKEEIDKLSFFQKLNLQSILQIQALLPLDGKQVEHTCSRDSYRVGDALSGKTERRISTSTNVPSGATYIRTELKDITNNRLVNSVFNIVGNTAIFSNLNPLISI